MKISELKNAPEWLVMADTKNADVDYNRFGQVVWNGGYFLGGEFRGGYFRGGEFLGGYFLGGEFLGGYFLGGEFRGGYFLGGEFRGGEFRGGEFRGGYFLGGEFLGGYFRGGVMMPLCKWVYGFTHDGKIKIGCKEKTLEDWEAWFDSDKTYSTPRGTEEFKKIRACFEAAKAYLKSIES
jgi:hypothetical protein